jgi:hypothetical protein
VVRNCTERAVRNPDSEARLRKVTDNRFFFARKRIPLAPFEAEDRALMLRSATER